MIKLGCAAVIIITIDTIIIIDMIVIIIIDVIVFLQLLRYESFTSTCQEPSSTIIIL